MKPRQYLRNLRSALSSLFNATWTAGGSLFGIGAYAATDPRRKPRANNQRPASGTANQALVGNLPLLIAHCRDLERNNPTARACVEALVANVVGSGIGLEPDCGNDQINARIRPIWLEFIADCAANGRHDIYYLQCQGMREIPVAGAFLWRLIHDPKRLEAGKLPLTILPLEAEWLCHDANSNGEQDKDGLVWVSGVGVNKYGQPIRYKIRNPEVNGDVETLPASQLIHDFERRRALQAHGEPWFSPVIEVMQQERELVDTELAGAKVSASIGLAIESEYHDTLDTEDLGDDTDPAHSLRLGGVARLLPGEKVNAFSHTRPSQQIAPFRQMLRGDIAAALRVPQRFLDRDVSRANYSSMRADMLDTERLLAPVREWFGHATIGRVYREVLPYLAMKAGVVIPNANYRLIPDGQPYVDPYKDAQAAAMSIASGLTSYEKEIGKRGEDYKKVWQQVVAERKEIARLGLSFDLSGTNAPAPESQLGKDEETEAKPKKQTPNQGEDA